MNRGVLALVALMVILVAGALVASRTRAQTESTGGSGWEYLVVSGGNTNLDAAGGGRMRKETVGFAREAFPLEQNMDKLGAKGWELVQVSGSSADPVFYFKRRK